MAAIDAAANLDSDGNIKINLPKTASQSGFSQLSYTKTAGVSRVARVDLEGELRIAHATRIFEDSFNGVGAAALLNSQWNQQATTMATVTNAGFLRFNSGSITTINTGVSVNTWSSFGLVDHSTLKLSANMKHLNGAISNKQFDFGLGYYDVAANQNAAMNEFVGFRWTQAGALIGVLEYSAGGAPTTVTVNINGGVPYSDNVSRDYEIFLDEDGVDFYVDGVYQGNIAAQADAPGLLKSATYPIIMRMFNAASAPPSAAVFDIGHVVLSRIGGGVTEDRPTLQLIQGKQSGRAQAGTQTANGSTGSVPASGTSPGALVPSNTVSGLVGLGGYGKATLTGVTVTLHSELIMQSFQNPTIPETAGSANNGRNLIITDLFISPLIVTTILAGGGFSAEWFYAYGSTALSLATADAIGPAGTPGTKSPVKIPLPIIDTLPATAAVGTISTRSGVGGHIPLTTPIVIAPGEFFHIGMRTLFVTAAVTSGAADYGIGINGYWQ